jgi:hypothetical protein
MHAPPSGSYSSGCPSFEQLQKKHDAALLLLAQQKEVIQALAPANSETAAELQKEFDLECWISEIRREVQRHLLACPVCDSRQS